jgi:RimJ/RimL family protein N-acetyltransferase
VTDDLTLRAVADADLPIFFAQQLDPEANHMAAFSAKDPADEAAFAKKWAKIRASRAVVLRTVVQRGEVVGHVASFGPRDEREITYWLGREYWGRGLATRALAKFLRRLRKRPLYARAAADNRASIRVLEKCGFRLAGRETSFADGRGAEIEEVILKLD